MKKIILLIAMLCLPLVAQVKLDAYRTIWYDSVYSAKKTLTFDLEMKYPDVVVVIQNKSATITDSLKLSSVTIGYKKTKPFNPLSFAVAPIWLKNDLGESISSSTVITLSPGATKELVVVNFAIQLLECKLLNVNANAKAYTFIKGIKQSQDRE